MIERLVTQRACLDHAVALVADLAGPVLELGLGKGRTYDHLRERLAEREILVLDRELHAPPRHTPPPASLVLGEFRETLAALSHRYRGRFALVHADIGSDDLSADAGTVREIVPLLAPLLREAAVVLGDREMEGAGWIRLPLPADVGRWPYYLYRVPRSGPA